MKSGSDVHLSFLGIDKVIEALRKLLEAIRDWKAKKAQGQEITKKMKLENVRHIVIIMKEAQKLYPMAREKIWEKILDAANEIEKNPNGLVPKS